MFARLAFASTIALVLGGLLFAAPAEQWFSSRV